jgi:hypothetical protein
LRDNSTHAETQLIMPHFHKIVASIQYIFENTIARTRLLTIFKAVSNAVIRRFVSRMFDRPSIPHVECF